MCYSFYTRSIGINICIKKATSINWDNCLEIEKCSFLNVHFGYKMEFLTTIMENLSSSDHQTGRESCPSKEEICVSCREAAQ